MNRLLLSLLLCLSLRAQTSRGTVSGQLSDTSGAAVTGAKVELKSKNTGVLRDTLTNESGLYRFDAVDLGQYEVSATLTGFALQRSSPFDVAAGQVRTIDMQLQVGDQKQTVEVVAEAQALQVEAPQRGANLTQSQITQLPFAGRNPVALALTVPGVSSNRGGFGTATFVVNGARGRSNNFLLDGTENNDISIAGQAFQIRNPDAVAEVAVQTSNYDSEFGRAGGGVVNVITKGGTNEFHGTAGLLVDVTNDDAVTLNQSIDTNVQKRGKPLPGTEQYWSGTVGGPLVRNKLFFFQSFQEQRQRASGSATVSVPSAAGRAALNSLFPAGRNPRVDLFNQVTGAYTANSQFTNVALGDGRPDIEFGTFVVGYPQTFRDRQTVTRIDYAISTRDQLSGRYGYDDNVNAVSALNFPSFITSQRNRFQNALISETHVFSPAVTNELRLAYNRIALAFPVDAKDPQALQIPLYVIAGIPASDVSRSTGGYMGIQTNLPQGRVANNYLLQNTMSVVRGTHTLRFGGELLLQRSRQYAPINERGSISFQAGGGFSGFANFIDNFTGVSGSVNRDFGNPAYYPNLTRQGLFVQDRWRVQPSLTITLGLRYEYFGTPMNVIPTPAYTGLFNIDPVNFTGPYSQPNKVNNDPNNFAPGVGLAYNPDVQSGPFGWLFGGKKTVIRTGYQLGFDSFFNNIASNAATSSPNVVVTNVVATAADGVRGIANATSSFPRTARPLSPLDGQNLIIKNLVNPYYQRWSFGIQRELPQKMILDVSYVGSKGTKLFATENFNPLVPASLRVDPPNVASIPAARLVNRYDRLQGARGIRTNNGSSNYHSLQTSLNRRMGNSTVAVAYTWAKLLDYGSEIFTASGAPATSAVPTYLGGLPRERGLSLADRPHRFVFQYNYLLPFFKEQRGFAGRALGGWSVSGLYQYETGVPVNISNGLDADGIDGANDRPDVNPNGSPLVRARPNANGSGYVNPDLAGTPAIDPSTARYIGLLANTGATPLRTGNLARNTFRNGPTNDWSVNFFKEIRLKERYRVEFRSEMYNVLNHPQRGLGSISPFSPGNSTPAADVTNSALGRFLNLGILDGGGRVIRYQLKFAF